MDNPAQTPRGVRRGFGQRLVALVMLAVFAVLIWLATSGRFDAEVDRVAQWLQALLR